MVNNVPTQTNNILQKKSNISNRNLSVSGNTTSLVGRPSIYIYPTTEDAFKDGHNQYIKNLIVHLKNHFHVVSKITNKGLIDVLQKINKCDILYFNWIEDVPNRRFGLIQVMLLPLIILIAKLSGIKIVWFVHNNISHSKKHLLVKRGIIQLMKQSADYILSHSEEALLNTKSNNLRAYDHPIDKYAPINTAPDAEYDLLIWGSVSPYKGISEFVDFVADKAALKDYKILIAGKFHSAEYYEYILSKKPANISLINKILPEEELSELFRKSKFVLFTYNSDSVLSSAALCKSLSFGKEIIGPEKGAFKELGKKGLIYNYKSFESLEALLTGIKQRTVPVVNKDQLAQYVKETSWHGFTQFLSATLKEKRR